MMPAQLIASGVVVVGALAAGALIAAIAYRAGQRDARNHRSARERRRRDWLASKILDLRSDLEARQAFAVGVLLERDELLKERTLHHPEHN